MGASRLEPFPMDLEFLFGIRLILKQEQQEPDILALC